MPFKVCCISDTHGLHNQVSLPEADLLIHAGDLTNVGEPKDFRNINDWFGDNKHKYKFGIVAICGNHDRTADKTSGKFYDPSVLKYLTNCIYLENSGLEINGVKIWGSPFTPSFFRTMWGFNADRGAEISKYWDMIPDETQVLITHGPPFGILDKIEQRGDYLGDVDLLNKINKMKSLRLHVSGHIHGGYGTKLQNGVIFANVSQVNEAYRVVNKPVIFEI